VQHLTYLYAITRFVGVLSLLPTRYLEDDRVVVLTGVAILGLRSPQPRIRSAGFKLARVLETFESDGKSGILLNFIREN
jgi:hypothetical protein